ncbi:hypothetical protein KL949_004969 [Ogataea haglerorum]|nr:hypothetical protein KL950_003647 [Ogataea haglerorum]KAG7713591.1 hypothetical protein KL913_004931 [Ogataea haglerorum]KAG7714114.1 hypothetical protein KL949_004969 [Ogataea haglerorum]KAG7725678.1 hypothetical protein KL948_004862 [Ogataea haglerorum]KAG7741460.1 hypothetical protein KL932_002747 [Ogataea haglerorum]
MSSSEFPTEKENVAPHHFPYKVRKPNRRHTLLPVPPRSILKASADQNHTIAIIPKNKSKKRRVSFATDVDVRSIIHRTHEANEGAHDIGFNPRRRDSLQVIPSYSQKRISFFGRNDNSPSADENEDCSQVVDKTQMSPGSIEEDNMSQPMEMSEELNAEVRELVRRNYDAETETFDPTEAPNLEATFNQIEEEDTMEFTQPVRRPEKPNPESVDEPEVSQPMDLAEPDRLEIDTGENRDTLQREPENSMEITQAIHCNHEEPIDTEETMEMTQINKPTADSQEPMEFTQPVRTIARDQSFSNLRTPPRLEKPHISTPSSSARAQKIRTDEFGSPQSASKDSMLDLGELAKPKDIIQNLRKAEEQQDEEGFCQKQDGQDEQKDKEFTEQNASADMSAFEESIIIAEKVPLAEVTMDSENEEANFEDDDDDYVHVTLPQFLNQVQVQFYDNIGPSERELTVTSEGSGSQALHKYVDAVTEFPNFDYFYHLIAQRKSGIDRSQKSINDFSEAIINNNPTSVREFYESTDEVQKDLKVNYQALASLARTIAEHGNLVFMKNSLEGLLKSYENRKASVNSQVADMEEIRAAFSSEYQECVKRKADLTKTLALLHDRQKNFANVDLDKLELLKGRVEDAQEQNARLRETKGELQKVIAEEEEKFKHVSAKLLEAHEEDKRLKKRVMEIKLPSQNELYLLQQQFVDLQRTTQVELLVLNEREFKVQIMKELEVSIDLSTGTRTLKMSPTDMQFSDLYSKFAVRFQSVKGVSLKDYFVQLRQSYAQFRELVRELRILQLYYQFQQKDNDMVITITKSDLYRLDARFNVDELLSLSEPVKVTTHVVSLCGSEFAADDILKNALSETSLHILQRMEI